MRKDRTFHPVGQGAFYSETIHFNERKKFTLVYDCGSFSLIKNRLGEFADFDSRLNRVIKSCLGHDDKSKPKVDVLVLSHFDMDHINGCKLLDAKLVFIPFLNPAQILHHKLFDEYFNEDVYINIRSHFPDSKIIQVLPARDDDAFFSGIDGEVPRATDIPPVTEENIENGVWLNGIPSIGSISSGEGISIVGKSKWEYIFYNPSWKKYAEDFLLKLKNDGVNIEKLLSEKSYFDSQVKELKDNYYKSLKNMNAHSLQLYSGSTEGLERFRFFSFPFSRFYDHFDDYYLPNGCLYCGDITVSEKWTQDYFTLLGSERISNIGTVQISHHGSGKSNGDKILEQLGSYHPIFAVISVGTDNKFHHPSPLILNNILCMGHYLHLVTETPTSVFTQVFY